MRKKVKDAGRPLKSEKEALTILADVCSRGEHCSSEMLRKMDAWQLPEDMQARIMEYLVEHKFVDDERYTYAFVKDKILSNKWGRKKIQQALWMKKIPDSIQKEVLGRVKESAYLNTLKPLLESKAKSLADETGYNRRCKLMRFAISRGFDMDLIKQCIKDIEKVDDLDDIEVEDENLEIGADETETFEA